LQQRVHTGDGYGTSAAFAGLSPPLVRR
jgi:hypothetical protein